MTSNELNKISSEKIQIFSFYNNIIIYDNPQQSLKN